MMTKCELEAYVKDKTKRYDFGAIDHPFPMFDLIVYDDMEDAFHIIHEHRNLLGMMCMEIEDLDEKFIIFGDRVEFYQFGKYIASSNDSSEIGGKLRMVYGAYKFAPRIAIPNEMLRWFSCVHGVMRRYPTYKVTDYNIENLLKYMGEIGVPWVDTARELVFVNNP